MRKKRILTEEQKQKNRQRAREYYYAHRDEQKSSRQKYREENREKILKRSRERHHEDKDARNLKNKEWREKNKEYLRDYDRKRNNKKSQDALSSRLGWAKFRFSQVRGRSRAKGYDFDLSLTDILDMMPDDGLCPVLGIPLSYGGEYCDNSATIDRFNPALGYVRGNVTIISRLANIVKQNVTNPNIFRKIADWIDRRPTACVSAQQDKRYR